jgi:outer membrane receptor for ferrienterochelin and colicins
LLAVGYVRAQTTSGTVVDNATGQSVPGAVVLNVAKNEPATTDSEGRFTFTLWNVGDSVRVMYAGYVPLFTVYNGQNPWKLSLEPITGPGVTVEAEQDATRIHSLDAITFQTLTEKELCKAACCSLAESFETNASVDASFTDAITGTRQIKMLGLDGKYSQVMFDNIPSVRGLSTIYGLSYVPGPWIHEISIAKGTGSVISGYESITGQINVVHKGKQMKERLFVNGYGGSQGRFEGNIVWHIPMSKAWSGTLSLHGSSAQWRWDMNKDGFLDNPLFRNFIARASMEYVSQKTGWRGEYTVTSSWHRNISGSNDFRSAEPVLGLPFNWGVFTQTRRAEFTAKTGYVFKGDRNRSFGSQVSGSLHYQDGTYGLRLYRGEQSSLRVNLMYASEPLRGLKQTSGISYLADGYFEQLSEIGIWDRGLDKDFPGRFELVPGVFTEWTYNRHPRWMAMAGVRADHHNRYGLLLTPRVHVRWSMNDRSTLKVSAGRGFRSPNLIMDHVGMLASNRAILVRGGGNGIFGLPMEDAWNFGAVFIHKFKLNYRDASFTLDAYHTRFQSQVVADWERTGQISFYALQGRSFSNSVQVELMASPAKRLEVRAAYRWLEAFTQYDQGLLLRPLIARHRFFANAAYATKEKENGSKWVFDATARWLGSQRLPSTLDNPVELQLPETVAGFWVVNAQVAYHFTSKMEVYVGGENLTNFYITNPIIVTDFASDRRFDASLVWGPVFGRMAYIGFRWRVGG